MSATTASWENPFGSSSDVWGAPSDPSPPPLAGPSKRLGGADDAWGDASDNDEEPAVASRSLAYDITNEPDDMDDFAEAVPTGDDDDFGDFDDGGQVAFQDQPVLPTMELREIRPGVRAEEIAPYITAMFERVFPLARSSLSDEPERQLTGDSQTLVTEESRHLFAALTQPSAVRPVDWKRSRVRKEHLLALGLPINMDEFTAPDTRTMPPLISSAPPRHLTSAAAAAGAGGLAAAPTIVSGKVHGVSPRPLAVRLPAIDRTKAADLLALSEEQLSLLPLSKLETMRRELQNIAADASSALTKALERRESLVATGEGYDTKIQELVMAAQRLKPGGANVKRSSSMSSKWGKSAPHRPASPASGGSGRSLR